MIVGDIEISIVMEVFPTFAGYGTNISDYKKEQNDYECANLNSSLELKLSHLEDETHTETRTRALSSILIDGKPRFYP